LRHRLQLHLVFLVALWGRKLGDLTYQFTAGQDDISMGHILRKAKDFVGSDNAAMTFCEVSIDDNAAMPVCEVSIDDDSSHILNLHVREFMHTCGIGVGGPGSRITLTVAVIPRSHRRPKAAAAAH
jgi:hypothetical protein